MECCQMARSGTVSREKSSGPTATGSDGIASAERVARCVMIPLHSRCIQHDRGRLVWACLILWLGQRQALVTDMTLKA